MANEYLVGNKRLGRVGSWRTDAFNWKHLLPDLQEKIQQATCVGFRVEIPLKWRLSREQFDAQTPDDAYDPMLHVVQTFEFSRPRTDTLGFGFVHFKYSQRAEAEPRPASEHDNYVTQEYVDKVVAGMQHKIDWDDIAKIRLHRWDYNYCTFEVVRKIDGRVDCDYQARRPPRRQWHRHHQAQFCSGMEWLALQASRSPIRR
jgi:hypothetical protein